jgi:hypothetical protein
MGMLRREGTAIEVEKLGSLIQKRYQQRIEGAHQAVSEQKGGRAAHDRRHPGKGTLQVAIVIRGGQ